MEITNPVVKLRKELGLTRNELAEATHLAPTTLQYIEWGAYGPLPKSVTELLSVIDPHIEKTYSIWKQTKRLGNNLPIELPEAFPILDDLMHPHKEWRTIVCKLGLNDYCSELCVPRALIQNVERRKQKKFPRELELALIQAIGHKTASRIVEASNG